MYKSIILKPRLSEKTYGLSQGRVYVFEVPAGTNKHSVASAVAQQFEVKVTGVNIANIAGKAKRTIRKGGRPVNGRTSDVKKAYVTLAEGQSLPLFAAEEEAQEKQQATQEKFDKVAAKQAEKEAKPARRGLHIGKREPK